MKIVPRIFHLSAQFSERWHLRLAALTLLCVISFAAGARLWTTSGSEGSFYQWEFGPAASLTCGRGFVNVLDGGSKLSEFLHGRKDALTCAEAFEGNPKVAPPNILQHQTVSLQYLIAGLWKLFGFSWSVTAIVTGALLAFTALATYSLSRQLLAFWPSYAIAALTAFATPAVSTMVVNVRDFAKAPFAIILMSLCLNLMFAPRNKFILLSTAAALTTAVGIGFRSDISLFLALIPLAMILRLLDNESWRIVAQGSAVFAAILVAYNFLLLPYWVGVGRNNPHFVILGHATQHIQLLGLDDAYQGANYLYNDIATHGITSLYAKLNGLPPPAYGSLAYDHAGRALLAELARTLPANELVMAATATYRSLLQSLGNSSMALVPILIMAVLWLPYRFGWRGLAFITIALLLGGISGVQFHPRHFFHLAIVGNVMLAAVVISLVPSIVRWLNAHGLVRSDPALPECIRTTLSPLADGRSWRTPMHIVMAALACFVVVVVAARLYQSRAVDRTVEQIARFPRKPLPELASTATLAGRHTFDLGGLKETSYIGILLPRPTNCLTPPNVRVVYEFRDAFFDWAFSLKTPRGDLEAAYFPVPVYAAGNRAASLEVTGLPGCAIEAVQLEPDAPFLPFVFFAGKLSGPAYQLMPTEQLATASFDRLALWMRPRECILRDASSIGGQPAKDFEQTIKAPKFIELTVAPTPDGYYSDHLDVGGAELVSAQGTLPLSLLPFKHATNRPFSVHRDANVLDKPLKIGAQIFERGLGLHAPAKVVLTVPEKLQGADAILRFSYGIDAQTAGRGSTELTVCLVD